MYYCIKNAADLLMYPENLVGQLNSIRETSSQVSSLFRLYACSPSHHANKGKACATVAASPP